MVTQSQQEKFQTLMRGTIISLCQNVLDHKSEIKVEVFIGITIDKKQDFHFSVVETLRTDAVSGSTEPPKPDEVVNLKPPAPPPGKSSSMLERLMTHDISPNQQSQAITVSPPKAREAANTMTGDQQQNLSYSELLRSFGEMSRQDGTAVPASNLSVSCPTLYNTLNSGSMSNNRHMDGINQGPVNQAQVVIPINFAIHSPSTHGNHRTGSHGNNSADHADNHGNQSAGSHGNHSLTSRNRRMQDCFEPNSQWNDNPSSSRSKVARYEPEAPDSTYTMPDGPAGKPDGDYNPFNMKVKQEVLSEEEMDSSLNRYHQPLSQSSPNTSSSLLNELRRKVSSSKDPSPGTDASAASRGILMSLLCERSPGPGVQGKKRGRPKRKPDDPPYVPKSKKAAAAAKAGASQGKRDNRVLIGLTDYLTGFKEGDLNQDKPPKCVFYSEDISSKTRKIVLLNSGPFATVRMVHRSLQGMRASEIGDVMRDMTNPRQHPEYVGEYKAITMQKLRQGRKMVGVFYKCPPELMSAESLKRYDIELDDYVKFFNQVFRYDRTPQPQYFQSIELFSPFYGTFGGDRGWREDPTGDPTLTIDVIHQSNQSNSLYDQTPGDTTEPDRSHTEADRSLAEPDRSHTEPDRENMNLCISGIKSEQADWESIAEDENDTDSLGGPVTSTQHEWPLGDEGSRSPVDNPDAEPEADDPTTASDDRTLESPGNSVASPDDYPHNSSAYTAPDFSSQPVFPQPLVMGDIDRRRKKQQWKDQIFPEQLVYPKVNNQPLFPHAEGQPVFPHGESQPVFLHGESQPVFPQGENQSIFPEPIQPLFPQETSQPVFPREHDKPLLNQVGSVSVKSPPVTP